MEAFQFSLRPGRDVVQPFNANDFTVLVQMGRSRIEDAFYVMPTEVVRSTISAYSTEYLAKPKRDGNDRKNTGHWTLYLKPLRSHEARENRDLQTKWSTHLNNWRLLDH